MRLCSQCRWGNGRHGRVSGGGCRPVASGRMEADANERRWLESSRSRGGVIGRATIPTTPFRACVSVFPRTSLPTRVSLWVGRTAAGSTTVSSRATAGGARDHSGLPPPSPSFARPPCPWRPGPSSHPTFGTVSSPARRQLVEPDAADAAAEKARLDTAFRAKVAGASATDDECRSAVESTPAEVTLLRKQLDVAERA